MNRWNAFCFVVLLFSVILFGSAFAIAKQFKRNWEAEYYQCYELRKAEARVCADAYLRCGDVSGIVKKIELAGRK